MPDPGEIRIKICGLTRQADVDAAVAAGAAYLGFTFFPPSPRYIDLPAARALATTVPAGVAKVALTVDADDDLLDRLVDTVPLDMLQLHGDETPARVAAVKSRYGLPVMKALGIADAPDLAQIDTYAPVADQLLLDTKAPKGATLPGGNGRSFDWTLLANRRIPVPWMLAGGLTPDTVGAAISLTGTRQVDVSSGVEVQRGQKDADLIQHFINAAVRSTVTQQPVPTALRN